LRILHTADWHLGHRLYDRDRTPEHRAALAWLLDTIEEEKVDVLIVAGDIFDVANPSNQARELYYEFLGQLARTKCVAAVIVGGNHDSPAMLDAPREVLRWLNLHVVGAARTQVQEEVIRIAPPGDGDGPGLVIAAVPYLRERDIRRAKFGETSEERLAGLQEGISGHYREVAEAAVAMRQNPETPIIATGHLFAGGASDHPEKKSYIYQADEHNIESGQFPAVFDYVALGHIHRAQRVGGQEHIRYCGSLVPLTFVEGQQVRSVRIVDVGKAGEPITSRQLNVPYFRTLLRLNAELDEVKQALRNAAVAHLAASDASSAELPRSGSPSDNSGRSKAEPVVHPPSTLHSPPSTLPPWAEVRVKTDEHLPNLRQTLLDVLAEVTEADSSGPPVELLRISQERLTPAPAAAPEKKKQLDELDPEEVFSGIVTNGGYPPERATELLADFRNLRNWMNDSAE
jgi:exonuclease SbcD